MAYSRMHDLDHDLPAQRILHLSVGDLTIQAVTTSVLRCAVSFVQGRKTNAQIAGNLTPCQPAGRCNSHRVITEFIQPSLPPLMFSNRSGQGFCFMEGLRRVHGSLRVPSVNVVEIPGWPCEVIGQTACVDMLRSGSISAASMSAKASTCM